MKSLGIRVAYLEDVVKHPNADRLDISICNNCKVVLLKGQFQSGEKVMFIEPDYYLSDCELWRELVPDLIDSRIKAVRLRGEISYGVVIKYNEDIENMDNLTYKREVHIPKEAEGKFPMWLKKTDETNWFNIRDREDYVGVPYVATLKIDGASTTFYKKEDKVGIGSRGLILKEGMGGIFKTGDNKYNILKKLKDIGLNIAIQGETYGLGINKSKYNPSCKFQLDFLAFNVFDIDNFKYYSPEDSIKLFQKYSIPYVPILERGVFESKEDLDIFIKKYLELKELDGELFEGVVVKFENGESFKILNLHYDSKK